MKLQASTLDWHLLIGVIKVVEMVNALLSFMTILDGSNIHALLCEFPALQESYRGTSEYLKRNTVLLVSLVASLRVVTARQPAALE